MLLQFEGVGKRYRQKGRDVTALAGLTFSVPAFQRLVIIGRSGSGKTTLLRLAAGLERPTIGEITFEGDKVTGPARSRLMVFQEPRLFPWATVYHNVFLGTPPQLARKERDHRVRELLNLVGLAEFSRAYPEQLSGGMAQRAALARALAGDPKLLLMDEPLGSLDAFTRSDLQQQLVSIWRERRQTVLFVTHDIEEAILLADRIIVLGREGTLLSDIEVNLPLKRSRTGKDFNEIRQQLIDVLFA